MYDMRLDVWRFVAVVLVTGSLFAIFEQLYVSDGPIADVFIRLVVWALIGAIPVALLLKDKSVREYAFARFSVARAKFRF